MATASARNRLDPEVFRLPVDRIRSGYYSDAYFNYTRKLLQEANRHPRVPERPLRHDQLHRRTGRGGRRRHDSDRGRHVWRRHHRFSGRLKRKGLKFTEVRLSFRVVKP